MATSSSPQHIQNIPTRDYKLVFSIAVSFSGLFILDYPFGFLERFFFFFHLDVMK